MAKEKVSSRANVASSFTIVKGAMIDETYAVFAAWDFARSKRANLDRLREENFIGASSTTWLRDVAKVLNRRFEPDGRDRPLVLLAKSGCDLEEWKPLLLWHMTRDEFLLRDFLQGWLFAAFDSGVFRVRPEELHAYLQSIGKRGGTTEHDWSEETTKRVAAGLLKIAVDFGLLRGSVMKEFASYRLPERSFLYLLHALRDEQVKSYVIQEISPYAALLTGGSTVANLFGHMSGRQKGMVQIWDVVGFDEVADLQKMPKEVITTMKTYCESGTFQRGQEAVAGDAGIAMFGNTNQPIDVMVQTGHLFAPMPDVIRDDMAFIDRLHFYLPGWEIPKMRNDLFTDHYGFVVDYLAEALREMRKHNFTEVIDRHFSMGTHLNARDRKAVRKTVSGLMKILYPHGEVTQDELAELLELALEGRRRVKEQLKKMGAFEYYHTSFSYTLQDTGEEKFVGVPEQGGRNLISAEPLAPGTVYTAGVTSDGTVGLYRLEVSVASGTGKLKTAGGLAGAMKESVQRAFSYIQSKKSELGLAHDLDSSDLHVEVMDLLGNRVEAEIGVAFFVAAFSAFRKAPVNPGLLVLGDMSVQGNIKPLRSLVEPLQVAKDNGAKRALIPIENKRTFLEVSADIVEHVDPIFYGDPKTAAMKVLGG